MLSFFMKKLNHFTIQNILTFIAITRLENKKNTKLQQINSAARQNSCGIMGYRQKKTLMKFHQGRQDTKKPAPSYSPAVKYAVPSPLGPLSIVFGMGT